MPPKPKPRNARLDIAEEAAEGAESVKESLWYNVPHEVDFKLARPPWTVNKDKDEEYSQIIILLHDSKSQPELLLKEWDEWCKLNIFGGLLDCCEVVCLSGPVAFIGPLIGARFPRDNIRYLWYSQDKPGEPKGKFSQWLQVNRSLQLIRKYLKQACAKYGPKNVFLYGHGQGCGVGALALLQLDVGIGGFFGSYG